MKKADHLDEFDIRLKAALMLSRSERIRFCGADKLTLVGESLAVIADTERGVLVIRSRPVPCEDCDLRASFAALPSEAFPFAEIHTHADEQGIAFQAIVELGSRAMFREELQLLRAELELRSARIDREVRRSAPARRGKRRRG